MIWKLLIKDLKIFFADKKASLILIFMPIILMTILGYAIGGMMRNEISPAKIALVKKYKKEKIELKNNFGKEFVGIETTKQYIPDILDTETLFFKQFLDKNEVKKWINYEIMDEAKAQDLYEKGKIDGVLILDEAFSKGLSLSLMGFKQKPIELILYMDKNNPKALIVEQILNEFTDVVSYIGLANEFSVEKLIKEKKYNDIAKTMGENSSIINKKVDKIKDSLEEKNVAESKKKIDGISYYSIGMMAMFMLFGVTSASRTLLKEKENGTFGRLIMSGVDYSEILFSKYLFAFLITFYQFLVMTAYGKIVLKIEYGNSFLYLCTLIITSLSLAAISFFLLTLTIKSNSFNLVNLVESVFIQIMALLGGSMIPVDSFPKFMQKISDYIINGVFIKTILSLSGGGTFLDIKKYLFTIVVNGLIFLVLALLGIKSMEVFDVNAKRKN